MGRKIARMAVNIKVFELQVQYFNTVNNLQSFFCNRGNLIRCEAKRQLQARLFWDDITNDAHYSFLF